MAQLTFYGPFHFNEIQPKKNNYSQGNIVPTEQFHSSVIPFTPNLSIPGIYIWGFMYEYNPLQKELLNPLDFSKGQNISEYKNIQFIPYYVGKKKSSISSRLNQHHSIITPKADATKFLRLSLKYMKEFFKDDNFPIYGVKGYKEKLEKKINANNKDIEYINSEPYLRQIFKGQELEIKLSGTKNKDCPIIDQKIKTSQGFVDLEDTLYKLIAKKNNFFFCYAEIDYSLLPLLERLETQVFWSLKGRTISKTQRCPTTVFQIEDYTQTGIFKKDLETCQIVASEEFKGYV